jgi:hypothetical protein
MKRSKSAFWQGVLDGLEAYVSVPKVVFAFIVRVTSDQ